ncbi:Uma2 family endonuclease [Kribbella amoyensis]|uniref:Uma2 family endonuclease n=1 Tax=Kribbella amoyensis TaxID=996641 RepID=A0A561B730_9ACTN|nr:Uma2 family endonuclease [Kribbella amoyensis]TWD74785.1 Uma2 family endonuclease [Kribbella amoyensis]
MTRLQADHRPRDARRYEIADGRLLVTGTQPPAHQAAVVGLLVALKQACPPGLRVAVNSLDFRPTPHLTLRPDLLVCPAEAAGPQYTPTLLLAVEVISPTTRTTDVVLKRALYERAAVPAYWLLDPAAQELTILHLTPTGYTCETVIQAEEIHEATFPFPVTLCPTKLLS